MHHSTRGVVLSLRPYNDRSQFVSIYTEALGKIACRVNVAPRRRGAHERYLYTPFSMLDMVVEERPGQEICQISEATLVSSPLMQADPAKNAQSMYMAELLDKTIFEQESNPKLWQFVEQSVEMFALIDEGAANFHLLFTTRLCYLIGFHVDTSAYRPGMQFDISEGVFTDQPIGHPYYLTSTSATWLHMLLSTRFSTIGTLRLSRDQRNILLDMMLTFFRIHLPDTGEMKTVAILRELF